MDSRAALKSLGKALQFRGKNDRKLHSWHTKRQYIPPSCLNLSSVFFPAGFFSSSVSFSLKHEGAHDKVALESEKKIGMRAGESAEGRAFWVWLKADSCLNHPNSAIFVVILQDVGF